MEIRIIQNVNAADLNIIPPKMNIAERKTICLVNAEQLPEYPTQDRCLLRKSFPILLSFPCLRLGGNITNFRVPHIAEMCHHLNLENQGWIEYIIPITVVLN